MAPNPTTTRYAPILWVLLILFCLRVVGQMLGRIFWRVISSADGRVVSGFLAYPLLLASQFLIIALFTKICIDSRVAKDSRLTDKQISMMQNPQFPAAGNLNTTR